jgi:whirlin
MIKFNTNFNDFQIGDQILDVNGISFLDISHSDAVACLRSSRQLIITVKDVGKIPHAMTSYDKTNWIDEQDLTSQPGKSVEKSSNG